MTAGTQQQKKGKLQPKQQITSEIGAFDSHRISIIRGALSSDECGKRQFALLHYKLQTLQICWNHWQFLQLLQISGCPPVEPSERVIKGMHAEFLRFKSQLWRRVKTLQHRCLCCRSLHESCWSVSFHNDLFSLWNKKLSWHHLCCDAGETACCVPLWCHSGLIKVRSLW